MTDAQQALAQVREALAAGPTPGPWVTMPANAGVHCVARINAWEAVPPSDCELSHDSIDASFIAACSPANIAAILAHVEAQKAEIERLTAALQWEQSRAGRQCTHGDGCADWGPEHYECAIRERDDLLEALHQLIAVIGLTAIKYKSDLDILQAAVDEASAAIAKAEGRQRC